MGALLCPPVPGPFSVPPSRADPRTPGPPTGRTPKVKNVFRFKIDAKSIPEALATTILILQKFSIDLAHRQNPGASAHPDPSGTPHPHPWYLSMGGTPMEGTPHHEKVATTTTTTITTAVTTTTTALINGGRTEGTRGS